MIKIILLITLVFLTNACGGGTPASAPQDDSVPTTPEPVDQDPGTPGQEDSGEDPVVGGGSVPNPNPGNDNPVTEDNNTPAGAPQNLVGIAYTETEIEIFWEKPLLDSPAVSFRIYRDDVLLETRDGFSFYENNLTPATEYTYIVEPMMANNQPGPTSSIALTTKPRRPTINADNAEQVLAYLHKIIVGNPFNEMRDLADALFTIGVAGPRGATDTDPLPMAQGLTLVTSSFEEGVETYSTNCELGGQYVFSYVSSTTPDGSGSLDSCTLENINRGNPIWGDFALDEELSDFQMNVGIVSDYTFTNFRAVNENWRLRELNGRLFEGANDSTRSWTVSRYTSQVFEGQTSVENAAIKTTRAATDSTNPEQQTREADFQIQAPETSNKVVYVKTSVPFVRDNLETNFSQGTLEITGADGSSMTMNADNGDINTFNLSVTAEGSTTSETLSWSVLL